MDVQLVQYVGILERSNNQAAVYYIASLTCVLSNRFEARLDEPQSKPNIVADALGTYTTSRPHSPFPMLHASSNATSLSYSRTLVP